MKPSFARVNWKSLQENNVRPSANSSWTWQKPRSRSKVKFIPNPRTTAKVVRVASKGDTTHTADRRACTVHALSNVMEIPFFVAQAALRQAGRKANKGFHIDVAACKNLIRGFRFHKVNRRPITLGKFLAKHPVGRFLVMTPSHAFAVIHGKVVDNLNTVGVNRRLTHAFTVKWDAAEDERKAPRQIVAAGGKVVQASDKRVFTGVLERAEVKMERPFHPSYYAREQMDVFVDCALRTEDGSMVYFKSPKASRTVASCPMAAVVVYVIRNGAKQWLREEQGDNPVATPGKPSTCRVVALVNAGDKVTVEGTVKVANKVSRKGRRYTVINRVRLLA